MSRHLRLARRRRRAYTGWWARAGEGGGVRACKHHHARGSAPNESRREGTRGDGRAAGDSQDRPASWIFPLRVPPAPPIRVSQKPACATSAASVSTPGGAASSAPVLLTVPAASAADGGEMARPRTPRLSTSIRVLAPATRTWKHTLAHSSSRTAARLLDRRSPRRPRSAGPVPRHPTRIRNALARRRELATNADVP